MKRFMLLTASAMLVMVGCDSGEENDGGGYNPSYLKLADVKDAQALYLIDNGTKTRASDDYDLGSLYKLTGNGSTKKVDFTDEDGKSADPQIQYVYNASDKFIIMNQYNPSGSADGGNGNDRYEWMASEIVYFIRKSDGAVFTHKSSNPWSLSEQLRCFGVRQEFKQNSYWPTMYSDKHGNLYYNCGDYEKMVIYKVSDSGGTVTISGATSPEFHIQKFAVNQNGDIWLANNGYVRLSSGSYIRTNDAPVGIVFTISDKPDNFYNLTVSSGQNQVTYEKETSYNLIECVLDGSGMTTNTIISGTLPYEIWYYWDYDFKDIISLAGKTIAIFQQAVAVINGTESIDFYNIEFHGEYRSDSYMYAIDNADIKRFDPTNGTVTTIYTLSGNYHQITNMRVTSDDVITFSTFDLNAGTKVVMEVINGQASIIENIDGHQIIQMERIN